jgi:hypothetical protein
MQSGYSYLLMEPIGCNFNPKFLPELLLKEMLALGVFCGKYMTDCQKEFPASWFAHAKLSPGAETAPSITSLSKPASRFDVGRHGRIHPDDPRVCHWAVGSSVGRHHG